MAAQTNIAWADATFNPWMGCTAVSPACDHCYAEARMDTRLHVVKWGAGQPRKRTSAANWREPLKWDRKRARAIAAGENPPPHRVFCASLADVFDNEVADEWRADLFALIRATPNLTWMLLTKRIGNVDKMLARTLSNMPRDAQNGTGQHNHSPLAQWPWPNVWIGATICNQEEADRDIPKLLALPAAKRFVSIEPMLGAIKLNSAYLDGMSKGESFRDSTGKEHNRISYGAKLDWVICGGESGRDARPMHPDWARSLRDQCSAAGTAFFFKQWGEWLPWMQMGDTSIEDDPEQTRFLTMEWVDDHWKNVGRPQWCDSADGNIDDEQCTARVGTKAAGHLLDGVQWQQFPRTPPTP